MKPWRRFIFVFIAYGIALLHTAVPHQHLQGDDRKTTIFHAGCVADESMGGFLTMIFSTDLGYGHLENFQRSADTDIDFSFAPVAMIALLVPALRLPVVSPVHGELLAGYFGKIHKRLLLFSTSHFRAPPFLINLSSCHP